MEAGYSDQTLCCQIICNRLPSPDAFRFLIFVTKYPTQAEFSFNYSLDIDHYKIISLRSEEADSFTIMHFTNVMHFHNVHFNQTI